MKYLVNISEKYVDFDYYRETYKNFYEKHKIKTIIFCHPFTEKTPENTEFMEFFVYEKYFQIVEKLESLWKENIFYINTFDEKLVLLANNLKKDLNFSFSEKFEIFRNKDLQRKFLLETFPETTVNFQKIDLEKENTIKIDFPCIIKPTSWVQSAWVTFLKNLEDFENFRKNFLELNNKLKKRWLGENSYILEEFIDWQMYTIDYFVDENGNFFKTPIVKIELASKLGVSDFANYARIAWKTVENEVSVEEIKNFIQKNIKTFGLKNTFVHHEFKKNNSWVLKTIELNWRIWGYRLELFKENYFLNMFDLIVDKKDFVSKIDFNYSAFVFYAEKEWILEWFSEKIENDFRQLSSFLSIKKLEKKVWEKVWLTKDWYSSLGNLKLRNDDLEKFEKDLEFVWENYKNFIILKK